MECGLAKGRRTVTAAALCPVSGRGQTLFCSSARCRVRASSLKAGACSAKQILNSRVNVGLRRTITRNSVVKIVSDDTNNKLVDYAVRNSSSVAAMVGDTKSEAEKSGIWEKARQGAVYRLDDTILMNSRNRAAQEVTCIGPLYVTVADGTAQKQIEFKVKQTTDGQTIVSVNPFLF
jgi:hypothetical protein